MKKLRRFLGLLLAAALLAGLLPARALAAPTDYGLTIAGVKVTSDNWYDPLNNGVFQYMYTTKSLVIRGDYAADIPVMADYAALLAGERLIWCTHGHLFHPDHLPPLSKGDVMLFGHTHVPGLWRRGGVVCLNPGSTSIPKENSPHSCMLLEGDTATWVDLATGRPWRREQLKAAETVSL